MDGQKKELASNFANNLDTIGWNKVIQTNKTGMVSLGQ